VSKKEDLFVKIHREELGNTQRELARLRHTNFNLERDILVWKTRANAIRDSLIIVAQPNVDTTTKTISRSAYNETGQSMPVQCEEKR
jgi:hypothetical protein